MLSSSASQRAVGPQMVEQRLGFHAQCLSELAQRARMRVLEPVCLKINDGFLTDLGGTREITLRQYAGFTELP